jgi:cell division septum initiation protein DivIVA
MELESLKTQVRDLQRENASLKAKDAGYRSHIDSLYHSIAQARGTNATTANTANANTEATGNKDVESVTLLRRNAKSKEKDLA